MGITAFRTLTYMGTRNLRQRYDRTLMDENCSGANQVTFGLARGWVHCFPARLPRQTLEHARNLEPFPQVGFRFELVPPAAPIMQAYNSTLRITSLFFPFLVPGLRGSQLVFVSQEDRACLESLPPLGA